MATLITSALMDVPFFESMADEPITANTDEENRVINCINFVTLLFESFCNRHLAARDYSYDPVDTGSYDQDNAIFDGPDSYIFRFPTYPVNSITEFIISDNVITAATSYTATDGYHLYTKQGKLKYYGAFDYGYPQNVKVKWNGGYAVDSPERIELKHLCFQVVKDIYFKLDETGSSLKSETIGTYSYQNFSPNLLEKYKSMHPMAFHTLVLKYRREAFA